MMDGYGMAGGWGLGGIFMILWWLLIIVGIAVLLKWILSPPAAAGQQDNRNKALEILKERYARGEIDEEEFHKRKRGLSQ